MLYILAVSDIIFLLEWSLAAVKEYRRTLYFDGLQCNPRIIVIPPSLQ